MIQHLAIIMDGNRRWASKQGLAPWLGHNKGAEAIFNVVKFCLQEKIKYLSLYAFSLENFRNRSEKERLHIFNDLLVAQARKKLDLFLQHDVRIQFIGDNSYMTESVQQAVSFLEEKTKHCMTLQLNILFCYGARQEIFAGVQKLLSKVQEGIIPACKISMEDFQQSLWTASIPDPDLVIRTGGLQRLSNFLLYQAAYSEFYFLNCLWPDITDQHLQEALQYFKNVQRNFGI